MKPILVVLIALFCSRAACAGELNDHSADGVAAFAVSAPNGRHSLLLGIMHVPVRGLLLPSPAVLAGKRHFILEHLGETPRQTHASPEVEAAEHAERAQWATSMNTAELDTYHRRASCAGKSPAQADELLTHPEVRDANQIAYAVCGLNPYRAADVVLTLYAMVDYHLKPEYLESDAFVQRQRLKVPEEIQRRAFRSALSHDPAAALAPVADALNAGAFDQVERIVDGSLASSADAVTYRHIMVDERNVAWMTRLHDYLNDGDAAIVVGAAHLPGPDGLVARLRADGYQVEPVRVPALP